MNEDNLDPAAKALVEAMFKITDELEGKMRGELLDLSVRIGLIRLFLSNSLAQTFANDVPALDALMDEVLDRKPKAAQPMSDDDMAEWMTRWRTHTERLRSAVKARISELGE